MLEVGMRVRLKGVGGVTIIMLKNNDFNLNEM